MSELHVVYGSGPVGTAVAEILAARGKRLRVVAPLTVFKEQIIPAVAHL